MKKVLLIDDDADLRAALAECLHEAGYEVVEASDGAEALDAQRRDRADLVITDLFMPGQEGMETVSALRREQPGLKIIAMSAGIAGRGQYDYLSAARTIGADRCLRKPFKAAELISAVSQLLAASDTSPGAR